MTLIQSPQDQIERLTLHHGRVQVREGYADGLVRVFCPDGNCHHVNDAGLVVRSEISWSVDWSE